jgi:octaprenyl-diphosphate synthase
MTINALRALVQADFEAVNALILEKLQSQVPLTDELSSHIMNSGGKRLRPLLVLLASRACAYEGPHHITLAAMVEFFHTATLLHDDVVDESALRRGKETAHNIWGSKASILVGDYLYTESIQVLVGIGHMGILRLMANVSQDITIGELKQLANRNQQTWNVADYFEVIRAKTALLFAAAACVGAHLNNSGPLIEQNLYNYGLHLGNAFQLIDDALDFSSDSQTIGKNIGDDLKDGKATLPLIYALEHATKQQQQAIQQSLQQGNLDALPIILETLKETKAIEYTKSVALNEIDAALNCLQVLPDSPYKKGLIDLAHFVVERQY